MKHLTHDFIVAQRLQELEQEIDSINDEIAALHNRIGDLVLKRDMRMFEHKIMNDIAPKNEIRTSEVDRENPTRSRMSKSDKQRFEDVLRDIVQNRGGIVNIRDLEDDVARYGWTWNSSTAFYNYVARLGLIERVGEPRSGVYQLIRRR